MSQPPFPFLVNKTNACGGQLLGMYFDVLWQVHVVITWKIMSELTYILCGTQLDIIEIHKVAVGLICHFLISWLPQFLNIYHLSVLHTTKNTHVVPFYDFFCNYIWHLMLLSPLFYTKQKSNKIKPWTVYFLSLN